MKNNNAFTLTEILLAVGIIGIIATVVAPTIKDLQPNKNKINVMNITTNIEKITSELLDDLSIYIPKNDCNGITCDNPVIVLPEYATQDISVYSGNNKLPQLLADRLNNSGEDVSAVNGTITIIPITGIRTTLTYDDTNTNPLSIEIITQSKNATPCKYGDTNCKTPNKFTFTMSKQGKIIGADYLSEAFLKNPKQFNNSKQDYNCAKALEKGATVCH